MNKRDIISYISCSILLVLFVVIMILVVTNNITSFDNAIYNFLISFKNNGWDFYMKLITKFGNTIPVIIIIIVLMITLTSRKEVVLIGLNTIITVGLNQILKHIICRARPDHLRLITEHGYSFPSGHSMISVCLYGLLIYLINKKIRNKILKVLLTILLVILILSIGISRIYVGVHYPSDVFAGYLLSLAILLFSITTVNKYFRGNRNEKGDNL